MIEPAEVEPELPRIMLAGKEWPIREVLGWRQLSQCRMQILTLHGRVNAAIADLPRIEDEPLAATFARHVQAMSEVLNGLSNEEYDELVIGPLFVALTALHPTLKREEFDAWPVTEMERQWAWIGVRRNSGLVVIRDAEEAPPPPGEAIGGA